MNIDPTTIPSTLVELAQNVQTLLAVHEEKHPGEAPDDLTLLVLAASAGVFAGLILDFDAFLSAVENG